ncbi:histidine--tRNA ligase [Thermoanaerobacterium sp. RBIITD]|uniref:histidine--tRNA ligase n=1 Tax=Thermoanaerobacterium sp. RBIITD TaxID=1550240 RepID=UPI000BB6DBB2|nr:histidine--tRNA ligase [Thermoanaerobacterium sp. RBIITD]SNX55298.1 histidyl-tRNA synthetase [Thermoanaerobacterium sp. RBIITD]
MLTKAPRGTKDVLPTEVYKWHYIENIIREICENFGFKEIRTPGFEHTELFLRGVGESTDIVRKEMYTFTDKGGRSITLKPEGTSPAVRAFVEHNLYAEAQPTKLYYITPVYRYERPQSGRLREHHQFGVEMFGSYDAAADAEIVSIAMTLFKRIGLKNLELNINSIGCPKCRKEYNKALKEFIGNNIDNLCDDCKERYKINPMRVLDCKVEGCKTILKDAPVILDYLCDDCKAHFEDLKKYLNAAGFDFIVNPGIVRGLDYYTRTAFEIISNEIGAQGTVCGGGRYDGLVEECGGPSVPGVGFGMGIERLLISIENSGIKIPLPKRTDLFIGNIGDETKKYAFSLALKLRNLGFSVEIDNIGRSLKAQMKYANKLNVKYTVILGEDELKNKLVKLKNMDDGTEYEIALDEIADKIKNI